jgi:hypothetical protein
MDITNQGIALGDLATAVSAAAGIDLANGGGFRNFGATVMEMGGGALIACQVADLLEPRAEDIWKKLYKSNDGVGATSTKVIRGVIAASAFAGMLVLARGAPLMSRRTMIPSAIAGGSCVVGHMVSEWYIKMQTEKKAKEASE